MLQAKKLLYIASLLSMSAVASAETITGTFNVVLNLQNVCVVKNVKSTEGTDFGTLEFDAPAGLTVDVTSSLDVKAGSGIEITCAKDQNYHIALGPGQNASSQSRQLKGPNGELIPYGLYRDGNHSTAWGNGTFGARVDSQGTGNAQNWTVYGQIPKTTTIYPSGLYADTVEVEIGW